MTIQEQIANELRRRWSERLANDIRHTIGDAQREMWAVAFHPVQDAPALGYLPSLREYVGAVDATPPVVGRHDPIADLVKAYKLIRDHPEYP